MPLDLDDPRLTAYALGELDASDRPALEAELQDSAPARETVAQIRAMAAILTRTLADEAVAAAPTPKISPLLPPPQSHRSVRWAAMAAALLMGAGLGVGGMVIYQAARPQPLEVAARTPAMSGTPAAPRPATAASEGRIDEGIADQGQAPSDPSASRYPQQRGVDPLDAIAPAVKPDASPSVAGDPASPPPAAPAELATAPVERKSEQRAVADSMDPAASDPKPLASNAPQGPSVAAARGGSPGAVPAPALMVPEPQQGKRKAGLGIPEISQAQKPSRSKDLSEAQTAGDVSRLQKTSPGQQADQQYGMSGQQGQQARKLGRSSLGVTLSSDRNSVASPAGAAAAPAAESETLALAAGRMRTNLAPVDNRQFRDIVDQDRPPAPPDAVANNEGYQGITENPFEATANHPLSTFSIDVDTASYANIRRFLNQNMMPPRDAVRVEEMINYFPYTYEAPRPGEPFSVAVEVARCPWNDEHQIAKIALKGRVEERRSPSNLVFLIDVSGSMNEPNKLPLVKQSLKLLAEQMTENDRVAIVVYAGSEGLALPSTNGEHKAEILSAIDQLESRGSTNGGAGIVRAYEVAVANFIKGGVNRVILATDGDFNVGVTDRGALEKLIIDKAKSGVFLSVLGVGTGNVKDATMETLADKGNGNYAYLDSIREARKVLVEQMGGTLVTIAKDVKIQVDFNAARVAQYRLIGYENRALADKDFADDTKDAGEIGAGHTVTALYELILTNRGVAEAGGSKYAKPAAGDSNSPDLFTVKLRYKSPDGDTSKLLEKSVADLARSFQDASIDLRFAASVAGFGMLLRGSTHAGNATYATLAEWADAARGDDPSGYRREFVDLVRKARRP